MGQAPGTIYSTNCGTGFYQSKKYWPRDFGSDELRARHSPGNATHWTRFASDADATFKKAGTRERMDQMNYKGLRKLAYLSVCGWLALTTGAALAQTNEQPAAAPAEVAPATGRLLVKNALLLDDG